MRRVLCLVGLVLVFALSATAQNAPKAEFSAGYSYVRINPGAPIEGANLHGGSGSIAGNVNDWFGIVADIGGYKLSELRAAGTSISVNATAFTYLFGPRLSYRKHERVTPFVQALFGGAHLGELTSGGTSIAPSENAFAMALGGGFDVKVSSNVAIRLVQAEYLLTRFGGERQNNARISAGIVFRWGGR